MDYLQFITGTLCDLERRSTILRLSRSMSLLTTRQIQCALAQNMATELIGRWFSGMAGSAFLSVSGGVVGDLFAPDELQAPMVFYTLWTFLGPDIGPLLGGFIDQYYQW